mmetsp:Transcript_35532/g.79678  ORF Transcript_35532/g.79678 Transcript_35532/m.79678 type:complete len:704 (+) Transcript_35532:126-2237(+)|eukprot:CAMPEP_0204307948 /NCGR_PEP_ID=MMETSP0469-20131031/215_1 /ASSEMBLY_ACC=CAM_ASM_000384 /TAXON_ID=2969 /ORGANISM="Oxyrrhis marina" /LENGTH=703 /DNA_ID=CAMNT_0051287355 /DNA_START=106 /DNA_END=2217 /DNA_ORIENTATION=+
MRVLAVAVTAAAAKSTEAQLANPIRRVVSLLQSMQSKIEAEGEEQDKMFSKFQCYCEKNAAKLSDAVSEAKSKIESLATDIESAQQDRAQTVADLANAKENRASSQQAIKDATSQRDKDAAAYKEMADDLSTNIAALGKAIPAIEGGMGGAFLQTQGNVLRRVLESTKVSDMDRASVEAFLQAASGSSSGYAPQSGEIVGILKQMNDTMKKDLAEAKAAEESAIKDFNELVAAQNKAIQAATDTIELKTEESGTLAVQIVQMQNDKADTEDQLKADTGFSAQLEEDCAQQARDYSQVKQTRADELLAIAETIKILNDDDVLELFKKTLPSLMQVAETQQEVVSKALQLVRAASRGGVHPRLDLIALALRGKKMNFDKVITMIDEMASTLKKEQEDDNSKKQYCEKEFDETEDRFKELKHEKERLDEKHSNLKQDIADTKDSIAQLEQGISDLDKAVAEATETRKEEHDDYVKSTAQDQAAVEILEFAKNRLQKFYNPKLYKEGPKRELSEEEKMYAAYGGDIGTTPAPGGLAGTGVSAGFVQLGAADEPGPAPAVGGYAKQKGGGVLGMIDRLVNDLKTEMNQHKLEEEDAQEDYEKLMADSAAKRAADSKAIAEHSSALAEAQMDLSEVNDNLKANNKNSVETHNYDQDLHKTCDFLLENFDTREKARTEEIEALDKAKAVLSGADVELLQTSRSRKFLSRK